MSAPNEATLFLKAESKGLKRGLDVGTARLNKFARDAEKRAIKLDRTFSRLSKAMIGYFSFRAITGVAKKLHGLYKIQTEAENVLRSQIETTGMAAGRTSEQMQEYASALQNVTNFGDEVTLQAMAIGTSFKSIKGAVFDQMIASAQDMSTVFKQDLNASVTQLGKALEDPINGMSALSRIGVTFTEQQEELIKSFVEGGQKVEAQWEILRAIMGQTAGAAEAAADPMTQFMNTLGDIGEQIAKDLVPSLQDLDRWLRQTGDTAADSEQKMSGFAKLLEGIRAPLAFGSTFIESERMAKERYDIQQAKRFKTPGVGSQAQGLMTSDLYAAYKESQGQRYAKPFKGEFGYLSNKAEIDAFHRKRMRGASSAQLLGPVRERMEVALSRAGERQAEVDRIADMRGRQMGFNKGLERLGEKIENLPTAEEGFAPGFEGIAEQWFRMQQEIVKPDDRQTKLMEDQLREQKSIAQAARDTTAELENNHRKQEEILLELAGRDGLQ